MPGAASASDGHSKEEKEDLESNRQLRSLLSLVFASFARALDVQGTHRPLGLPACLKKDEDRPGNEAFLMFSPFFWGFAPTSRHLESQLEAI